MAFWMTETAGGGFAMGEAADEAEARLEIARAQGRASVNYHERSMRYRRTVVLDDDKTHHGWADIPDEAWWYVKEALNRPHRVFGTSDHVDCSACRPRSPRRPAFVSWCAPAEAGEGF